MIRRMKLSTVLVAGLAIGIAAGSLQDAWGQAPPNADGLQMPNGPATSVFLYGYNAANNAWYRIGSTTGGALTISAPSGGLQTQVLATPPTLTNGTITAANTYQQILNLNTARKGCKIVNKGTDVLKVSPQAVGTSSDAQAFILAAGTATADGGSFDCATMSGVPSSNPVSVSSPTAGNPYFFLQQ